jgi:hypothetical protein
MNNSLFLKTLSRLTPRFNSTILVTLTLLGLHPLSAQAADEFQAVFPKNSTFTNDIHVGNKMIEGDLTFKFTVPKDSSGTMTPEFQNAVQDLLKHLRGRNSYKFITNWPNVQGVTATNGDYPPFSIATDPDVAEPASSTNVLEITVRLHGIVPERDLGEIYVKPLKGWKYLGQNFSSEPDEFDGAAKIRFSMSDALPLKPFRGNLSAGMGTGGPSVDFSGEGILGRPKDTAKATFTTLSANAKIPIGKPSDVDDVAGGESDASKKIADTITVSLNNYRYRQGSKLQTLGLRARTTGGFHGAEVVGYYNPLTGWFNESRGFYAAEVEAGWRNGDAEFANLTTGAPDRGSVIARLGAVAEWAPQMGAINKNLAKGLRFYVRGRGWFDTFKNADGKTSTRLRPFLDAEFFYNFTDEWRVFVRSEYGYVLPDLNTRVSRPAFVGVGASF